ncbi:MAG: ABC transporter permease [Flavobacteriaceae bacterium]|nr:ABC transporter permease [Flavobacteriaceae bacterium]
MYKLWIATQKEFLLLKRDLGGLAVLFIMPLILVVTVTLIQDSSFKQLNEVKIPILFVDHDKDAISETIVNSLKDNGVFQIVTEIEEASVSEETAIKLVLKGKYQLAIVIPSNLTKNLNAKIHKKVGKILDEFGVDATEDSGKEKEIATPEIKLFFDPAAQLSFKNGIKNAIDKMVSKIETQSIYSIFQTELEIEEQLFEQDALISFKEITPNSSVDKMPNSVQHNVPAWTLFAIFFIIIPLSINIVKEKNQGTFVRLKTSPVSYITFYGSKVITYVSVCMLQFVLMLMVGFYVFPYLGLPSFEINGSYILLFIVAFFVGIAAIGLGILLGTVATTTEQSAPFGATLVVILAAIGGVWVPVFIMPEYLQIIARISPMNWGINGFYDVILRDASFVDILPEISLLGGFFVLLFGLSVYYDKVNNNN